jgi:hypothetical protein
MTSLRNHKDGITAMDFFVVPTLRFRLLYVWFVIDHGRRRIIHFDVTANPTAPWAIQQLRDSRALAASTIATYGERRRNHLISAMQGAEWVLITHRNSI